MQKTLDKVLLENLKKNVAADLAEQEKLKKLSPAESKQRQQDYHEKTKKWVEAELAKRPRKKQIEADINFKLGKYPDD